MQLPESLQPWRQWLEWFAPELVPTLGALLGCISPVLGPFRGTQQGGVPEPDGLGDLRRRGSYERLLTSEWLLADEFADEFLRRASSGEHLFLAPQLRAQQASRLIVVLFDAGPLQLGGARLVHLALMILLARRAGEHGAQFRWGVLQQEPGLFDLHSSSQLRRLLDARTHAVATDQHWQRWQAFLDEQEESVSECWLVGQRLPVAPGSQDRSARRLLIRQGLFGQALELQMQPSGGRPIVLPLPDEAAARRLLKGQFDHSVPVDAHRTTTARIALTLPPMISSTGSHVAVRLLDDPGVLMFSIPRIGQKKAAKMVRQLWPREATPLGVTFQNRQIGAVLSAGDQLRFWQIPRMTPASRPPQEELLVPAATATLRPVVWLHSAKSSRVFLLTSNRTLAFWMAAEKDAASGSSANITHYRDRDVLGMVRVDDDTLVYASRSAGQLSVRHVTLNATRYEPFALGDGREATQVLFSLLPFWRRRFGVCAVQNGHGKRERWTVFTPSSHPQPMTRIELMPGHRAIGLFHDNTSGQCALVVSTGGGTGVLLVGSERTETLYAATSRILKISFCPASGILALITEARELVVYDVNERQIRLQMQTARKELSDE
ncbi:hypothetical protein [Pseudomonas gingeri]|uniref:Uncharacterized protein n=1 Tax=Pseudomonas gingeri TaxID=117681 RepID=A0A7Y8CIY1_9PSED|nr:hypothetical protein [Pseudomonas gingeri]NWB29613.1 hypothetical protein [Pseudomonas gingeri]NWC32422.1 hypothetical protein [Pseudomonas gingeri]NWD04766.1 hypothetical protein [Pseudomonas gingeri]NWD48198.1 hypothetical protein [Pseudomonas gingeri]NWE30868.1 hypothetical protein [Pseudomonas gingeri]